MPEDGNHNTSMQDSSEDHCEPPLERARRQVRERELTETIYVASDAAVPEGYVVVTARSGAVFAKAQVLSRIYLQPIFVVGDSEKPQARSAFWVHPAVFPELNDWIQQRVFDPEDV